jgi:HEAT repeat protein
LIAPRPEWRDALIDVYNFSKDNFARLHVVEAMYVMHDPVAVDTLTRALDDRASLVRHHAGRALLAIHGLASEAGQDKEHMLYRVMSGDARRRESGKADILAAIAGRPIVPSH